MDTNSFNQARREDAYASGTRISKTSSSHEVLEMLRTLVCAAIPGATIRENSGFSHDKEQVLSINMPDYSSNWVVIISNDTIRKSGVYCLKVFHLSSAIDFSQYYTSPFKNYPFHEAYAFMCMSDRKCLHSYHHPLTPEGLVVEMLCNLIKK